MSFVLSEQAIGAGEHRIVVSGELDLAASPALDRAAARALEEGTRRLEIDLNETTFIDSTAIRVLLRIHERMRDEGGELVIDCENERVLYIFKVAGLEGTLPLRRQQ